VAALMSLSLIVLLAAPLALLSGSLADGVEIAIAYVKPLLESGLPADVPVWVSDLPLIGSSIGDYWHKLVVSREELNELLRQFIAPTRKMALSAVQIFGQGLLQLVLVIFFAFFMFRDADAYIEALRTGSRKLAGDLGDRMLKLTEGTVTGVMVGIVGTAAAQSLVAMVGFIIVGVPGIIVLSVATFFFSMVPVVGATLIWLGVAAWLQDSGQTGSAIFMILWGMFGISSVDNLIKPILISRTSSLPLLLIVVGVFGGVLVFGFIGLFLGPTLLALGQVLIREWLDHVVYDDYSSIK
jgi:predicted PurR-regulated permease PerM